MGRFPRPEPDLVVDQDRSPLSGAVKVLDLLGELSWGMGATAVRHGGVIQTDGERDVTARGRRVDRSKSSSAELSK